MNKIISRKNCANCHFLLKTIYSPERNKRYNQEIKQTERDAILKNDFSWKKKYCSLGCSHTVWDEGYNLPDTLFKTAVSTKRDDCFFWKFNPGMLLPAAKELQKKNIKNKITKKQNSYIRAGLYISLAAFIISLIAYFNDEITKIIHNFIS